MNDLALIRFSSQTSHAPSGYSFATGDDTGDMDTRGKELAARCWGEDEEFLAREKIAEWLGGQ